MKDGKHEYEITREEYAKRYNATVPEEPEVPEQVDHVWSWFWQLSEKRQRGFDSPNPISYSDVESWARLTNNYILPEEVEAIMALDSAYLTAINEEQKAKRDNNE